MGCHLIACCRDRIRGAVLVGPLGKDVGVDLGVEDHVAEGVGGRRVIVVGRVGEIEVAVFALVAVVGVARLAGMDGMGGFVLLFEVS